MTDPAEYQSRAEALALRLEQGISDPSARRTALRRVVDATLRRLQETLAASEDSDVLAFVMEQRHVTDYQLFREIVDGWDPGACLFIDEAPVYLATLPGIAAWRFVDDGDGDNFRVTLANGVAATATWREPSTDPWPDDRRWRPWSHDSFGQPGPHDPPSAAIATVRGVFYGLVHFLATAYQDVVDDLATWWDCAPGGAGFVARFRYEGHDRWTYLTVQTAPKPASSPE